MKNNYPAVPSTSPGITPLNIGSYSKSEIKGSQLVTMTGLINEGRSPINNSCIGQ